MRLSDVKAKKKEKTFVPLRPANLQLGPQERKMSAETTAYPLCWPAGWKRTESYRRARAGFGKVRAHAAGGTMKGSLSVNEAITRVLHEIGLLGVQRGNLIISTNLKLRLDGLPYSDQREPSDTGAAVYWVKNSRQQMKCMAIDRYDRVADNLAAIAATVEAMRAIERHGGAEILERAFIGFQALPEPEQWWKILGFDLAPKTRQEAEAAFRTIVKKLHPDVGGCDEAFSRVASAMAQARKVLV